MPLGHPKLIPYGEGVVGVEGVPGEVGGGVGVPGAVGASAGASLLPLPLGPFDTRKVTLEPLKLALTTRPARTLSE